MCSAFGEINCKLHGKGSRMEKDTQRDKELGTIIQSTSDKDISSRMGRICLQRGSHDLLQRKFRRILSCPLQGRSMAEGHKVPFTAVFSNVKALPFGIACPKAHHLLSHFHQCQALLIPDTSSSPQASWTEALRTTRRTWDCISSG